MDFLTKNPMRIKGEIWTFDSGNHNIGL
jgi:hypothetical protein